MISPETLCFYSTVLCLCLLFICYINKKRIDVLENTVRQHLTITDMEFKGFHDALQNNVKYLCEFNNRLKVIEKSIELIKEGQNGSSLTS